MYNGVVIYRGPSMLDGKPIVAVATGIGRNSHNRKTGAMVQTYILRADLKPTEAIKQGADVSICGNCPHRTPNARTCYVNVGQGPLAVFNAYHRNAYPTTYAPDVFAGRVVRFGSYGDPAAVPVQIWENIAKHAAAFTGYTHQWRTHPELAPYCMASADSPQDAATAQRLGWRTFRVAMPCDPLKLDNESRCPASAEAGKKLVCADCRACNGTATQRRGSIVIQAHGGFAVMSHVRRKVSA